VKSQTFVYNIQPLDGTWGTLLTNFASSSDPVNCPITHYEIFNQDGTAYNANTLKVENGDLKI